MKLPCARHGANHLLVQELLLLAALSEGSTEPDALCGPQLDTVTALRTAAARLAQSPMSYEEQCSYDPQAACRLRFPPLVERVLQHRLRSMRDWQMPSPADTPASDAEAKAEEQTRAEVAALNATMPCTAPERLAALHAPPGLLPALPNYLHDTISYDAATDHVAQLTRLLQPYGFQVALAGRLRRGAPLARRCELVIGLTSQATEHIRATSAIPGEEAAAPDGNDEEDEEKEEETSSDAGSTAGQLQGGVGHSGAGNEPVSASSPSSSLSLPHSTSFPLSPGRLASHELREMTELCPSAAVYAVTDPVTRRLAYVYNRAVEGLGRAGYVVAGQLPSRAQWASRGLQDKAFTLRYYDMQPQELQEKQRGALWPLAPRQVTDRRVLRQLRLHQTTLHMSPYYAFHVRRLFLTGPAAFTAHVILRALEAGVELNMNGAFLIDRNKHGDAGHGATPVGLTRGLHYITHAAAVPGSTASASVGQTPMRRRVRLQSEKDLFRLIGMPYVDPLNRGIYCQVHDLFSAE